jgi:hypothetical protein
MTAATSITVRVPLAICRRGGRKLLVTPDGSADGAAPAHTQTDPALVKALARAHRWKRLMESGRHNSLSELAAAKRTDRSYFGKMLRLTLLAPDIVEVVLDACQPEALALPRLMAPFFTLWMEQRGAFDAPRPSGSRHSGDNGR